MQRGFELKRCSPFCLATCLTVAENHAGRSVESRGWAKLFRNYGNIVIVAKEIPEGFDNEDWEAQLNESGFLHVSR